jgi:hypothetical protein
MRSARGDRPCRKRRTLVHVAHEESVSMSVQSRIWRTSLAGVALLAAAGCDRSGPLSAVARNHLPPAPPAPAWSAALLGHSLASLFPGVDSCIGSVDGSTERYRGAHRVEGWIWNYSVQAPSSRLAVVDPAGVMVGFGEGGLVRSDVPGVRKDVTSVTTGYRVVTPEGPGPYTIYAIDAGRRSACRIGPVKS